MKNKVFIIFYIVLLSGCSGQPPKQGQLIDNENFSVNWNSHDWSFNKDKKKSTVLLLLPAISDDSKVIDVRINYNNEYRSSDFVIRSQEYWDDRDPNQPFLPDSEIFFDKNADYTQVIKDKNGIPAMMTKNHGGDWDHDSRWDKVVYIQGLKCLETTIVQKNWKHYTKTYCGYYDLNKGKRILHAHYSYDFKNSDFSDAQWQDTIKQAEPPSYQPLDNHLKDALSHLLSTLIIHNMDVARMQREGLLHINRRNSYSISSILQ